MTEAPTMVPALPATEAELTAAVGDEAHGELVATVQVATARWYERQREMMEALAALMHALILSRDPVSTAEAWMDWQSRALRRVIEDARDQRDVSLALARCCGDGRLLEPAAASMEEER